MGLWVGLGATGLIESLKSGLRNLRIQSPAVRAARGVALTVLLFAVSGQMLSENYADHDRSGRQVAWDAAYNMLTSAAEDSILFTYGDNDTCPLWYLQHVEGVRPDLGVVNLSMLGTPWYAKQLKEPSLASAPVPMSLSDEQIEDLRYRKWSPRQVQIPVRKPALLSNQPALRQAVTEEHPLETPMSWRLEGQSVRGTDNLLSPTNQVVYNILRTNAEQGWTWPVYFSVTTPPSNHLNLEPYFQLEGSAHRVAAHSPRRRAAGARGAGPYGRCVLGRSAHETRRPECSLRRDGSGLDDWGALSSLVGPGGRGARPAGPSRPGPPSAGPVHGRRAVHHHPGRHVDAPAGGRGLPDRRRLRSRNEHRASHGAAGV